MTQLIGALCEDRTKVILLSDRMVTAGGGSLAFEHEPKYAMMSSNAIVLTAGSVLEPEILEDAKAEISERAPLRQIAERITESYRITRTKRVEQEILEKYGITSFEHFYNLQQRLHEDTNLGLLKRIEEYELGVALVLGGVDDKGHLYYIDDPGACRSFDALGFCCVGSGDRHAEPVFAFYGFKPSISASQALQIGFEAKKRAEMAGGVGRETDAWLISREGCYEITSETIERLQQLRESQESLAKFQQEIDIGLRKLGFERIEAGDKEEKARTEESGNQKG